MRTLILIGVILLLAANPAFAGRNGSPPGREAIPPLIAYKTENCQCCSNHASYLRGKGYMVEVVVVTEEELRQRKMVLGIPLSQFSCHTTVAGSYFIEGHVPFEAIEKLFSERPFILGISLPGMPSASPGMPGGKKGPFLIREVSTDGAVSLFMSM